MESFDLGDVPTSHLIREMQRRLRCEQVPDTRTVLIGNIERTNRRRKRLTPRNRFLQGHQEVGNTHMHPQFNEIVVCVICLPVIWYVLHTH